MRICSGLRCRRGLTEHGLDSFRLGFRWFERTEPNDRGKEDERDDPEGDDEDPHPARRIAEVSM